jgi:hypothetical protein
MILTTHQDANGGRQPPTVSLRRVPGVTVTSARPETAPTAPTIRTATQRRNPTGIALQAAANSRRVEMLMRAMHEVAEGGV